MAKITTIKVKLDDGAVMPCRAHETDAGYDLFAPRDIYVLGQMKTTVDTGVHIEIPKGYFGAIRAKSGLFFKYDLFTDGTVDCGYTGAVKVRIVNLGHSPYQFHKGDKIAQLVLIPCLTPTFEEVEELEETERGNGGFGSTGK